jgi:HK97 family phage portal protein
VTLDGQKGAEVRELYALRPDRMKVVPGPDGWPEAYEYTIGARTLRFTQAGELPPILHLALFNPLDDHYGLAPIEAAAVAVDTHNAAAKWNKSLLDNAARPCGALVFSGAEGNVLADSQFERLKKELNENYEGARNAGRPLVLEGGLDWKAMSLTPKDMDFMEAKHAAAREIALAFGVPPMLLAIPGDNTYSNYQEANRVFWRQSVLPLAARIAGALAQWLAPAFGEGLRLAADVDRIEALAGDRAALWERVTKAPFLTVNEKRAAAGYAPVEGGDVV